jgi:1,4-alpha-glucan branching enzyme
MPPLMFMGEEWGTSKPFAFFCDFHGDLADAVRRGRHEEFAALFENASTTVTLPDPLDEQTFKAAVLDWTEPARSPHRERLDLVRRLLQVRRHEIVPRLHGMQGHAGHAGRSDKVIQASWLMGDGSRLVLLANLQDIKVVQPIDIEQGRQLWGSAYAPLEPWSVRWYLR